MNPNELTKKLTLDIQNNFGQIFDMYYESETIEFFEIEHEDVSLFINKLKKETNIFKNKDIKFRTHYYEVIFDDDGNLEDEAYSCIENIGKLSNSEIEQFFFYLKEFLDNY